MKKIQPFALSKEEVKDLVLSIIVLGFAFSFRDWGEGAEFFAVGIHNFIMITLLTGFSVFAHEVSHRWFAAKCQAKITFKTWKSLLLATIFIAFITQGYVIFSAIWTIIITTKYIYRPGFNATAAHLGPYERAKIAAFGPITNLAIAIIAGFFVYSSGSFIWSKLMIINLWLATFNLFPFFRVIPALLFGMHKFVKGVSYKLSKAVFGKATDVPFMEGEIVFYGSRPLWIFTFVFSLIISVLLLTLTNVLVGVILAFIVAVIFFLIWQYYVEPWSRVYAGSAKKILKM